jgi:hypothetical protein
MTIHTQEIETTDSASTIRPRKTVRGGKWARKNTLWNLRRELDQAPTRPTVSETGQTLAS